MGLFGFGFFIDVGSHCGELKVRCSLRTRGFPITNETLEKQSELEQT